MADKYWHSSRGPRPPTSEDPLLGKDFNADDSFIQVLALDRSALTTLKFEGPMDIDIIGFLQATPGLESLELIRLRVHPSPAQTTPTDLPHLTRLTIKNAEYGQLFTLFTFPSLRNLSIDPVEGQEPAEITWGKLQVPPAITRVKMEYRPPHEKLSIIGSNGELTRSLSLTERVTETRIAPMIQALCDTQLTSVTSLSVGRGFPESGVQLPSASICALISGLPHLRRLDLFPSKIAVAVTEHLRDSTRPEHLRNSPRVCPELRILSLTMVRETYEDVFWSLSGLATDRANSERWLHRIDCVILKERDAQGTAERWDTMSRYSKFGDLVRCNGGEEVSRTQVQVCLRCPDELPLCFRTLVEASSTRRCIRRTARYTGDTRIVRRVHAAAVDPEWRGCSRSSRMVGVPVTNA